jgi:phage shock protein A
MAMWQRFKRVIRSFGGWFISMGEDPELILKQNLRDMEDQEPKLNEHLAQVAGQKNLAERELQKIQDQETDITSKIKAALKAGKRDIALTYATELQQVQANKAAQEKQVKQFTEGWDNAKKQQRAFMAEKARKIKEAQAALSAARRAQYAEQVADAMKSFQVAGIDATHEEMIRKIEERAAVSEAKLEMALDSKKADRLEIEAEAQKLQANEVLRQFEIEMGLAKDASAPPEAVGTKEKTIGPQERAKG